MRDVGVGMRPDGRDASNCLRRVERVPRRAGQTQERSHPSGCSSKSLTIVQLVGLSKADNSTFLDPVTRFCSRYCHHTIQVSAGKSRTHVIREKCNNLASTVDVPRDAFSVFTEPAPFPDNRGMLLLLCNTATKVSLWSNVWRDPPHRIK